MDKKSDFWEFVKFMGWCLGVAAAYILVAPFLYRATSFVRDYWVWMDKVLGN